MRDLWKIFRIPLLLAAVSGIGLVSALVADGLGDQISWLALGSVSATILKFCTYTPNARKSRTDGLLDKSPETLP